MSSPDKATEITVLIVSDVDDVATSAFSAALAEARVRSEIVPDVYAATARLAAGTPLSHVVVDMRSLDSQEAAFLRLVRRFYPGSEVVVPAFEGVGERPDWAAAGFDVMPVDVVLDRIATGGDARDARPDEWESKAEQPEEPVSTPTPTLSRSQQIDRRACPTVVPEPNASDHERPHESEDARDSESRASPAVSPVVQPFSDTVHPIGGTTDDAEGPSLHEAVRERMAADGPRDIRRTPPPSASSGSADEPHPVDSPSTHSREGDSPGAPSGEGATPAPWSPRHSMLSPEEMDALLTNDSVDADTSPPKRDAEGGAV
ncbi:MAG: hypothetical protein ABII12_10990 [Planctomycetota bacterium]